MKKLKDLLYFTHLGGGNNSSEAAAEDDVDGDGPDGRSPEETHMSLRPKVMRTIHDFISGTS